MNWPAEILSFWFQELDPRDWWAKSDATDDQIRERFLELWEEQKSKTADAFSTDHLAQQIAEKAVDLELDAQLPEDQRAFLYMPFMHAEDIHLQNRSVTLFTKLGSNQKFANEHRDVIAKFGRFPHRNAVLGR
jgi:uncharacterized protein (DUF924 family)